jgi:hypothetical protein
MLRWGGLAMMSFRFVGWRRAYGYSFGVVIMGWFLGVARIGGSGAFVVAKDQGGFQRIVWTS